jgi:hypothetical protein
LCDRAEFGSDRIEVDVVTKRTEAGVGIDDEAFVAALEKVAAFAAQTIEAGGEGALQPLHAFDEIAARGGEGEVVVVRHDTPRMHAPTGLDAGLVQAREEGGLGFFGSEEITPIVAAIEDVINAVWGLQSQWSGHGGESATGVGVGQPQTPRPDPVLHPIDCVLEQPAANKATMRIEVTSRVFIDSLPNV